MTWHWCLSPKEKILKVSVISTAAVSLHLDLSIEIFLSSETSWLRLNYFWLNPMQIFYHWVVCTNPWMCRSCQFPSHSALPLTDSAVVSMSGFRGIYQKCCKIYLWNNLPTGKVLPYQFYRACARMCSLIFTIRTLPVLIIHMHVRHYHWQWYFARPRWRTSSWVSWARKMCVRWVRRQTSNSCIAAGLLVKVVSRPVPCWGIALAGMLAKAVGTAFPHQSFVSRAEASGLERQVQTAKVLPSPTASLWPLRWGES